jgi:Domain of unknown function (DUF4349)/Putative zinc-finger
MNRSAQHAFEPEEVMAYLDGELEPTRASSLAAHLDHCAECQALAQQFRQISERMLSLQVEASPTSISEWVLSALDKKQGRGRKGGSAREWHLMQKWQSFARNPFSWALGCIAILSLMVFLGRPNLLRLQPATRVALQRLAAEERASRSVAKNVGGGGGGSAGKAADSNGIFHGLGEHAENSFTKDGQPVTDAQSKVFSYESSSPLAPMVARTAALSIVVKDFGPVEGAVKDILARHHGYIGELSSSAPKDAAKQLSATLRIPSPQLDSALAELKQLGRVEQESQSGEEVSKQYTDLVVRLKNSQVTEQRLVEVLRTKTGKVRDILEVEREIARVRGEIEQMESDRQVLKTRVDYATLQLTVNEDFRASLQVAPPSTATRLHNAVVQGYHDVVESLIGFAVWLLAAGPTLVLWGAVLFFPARWGWKRWKQAKAAKISTAGAA